MEELNSNVLCMTIYKPHGDHRPYCSCAHVTQTIQMPSFDRGGEAQIVVVLSYGAGFRTETIELCTIA